MKRRYANEVTGEYSQKKVDSNEFKGYVCQIKIKEREKPFFVKNKIEEVCILDENYEWIEVYPYDGKYAITIMFDDKGNIIEWYFDISKNIGIENGIPYEDDLYLDMVITKNGEKLVLDEDELIAALNNGDITKEDFDEAYKTLNQLEEKYVNNLSDLIKLTEYLKEQFKNKVRK